MCRNAQQSANSSEVQAAACPCTRAIDRFLRANQQPTGPLANQNATSHLRQSGRHLPPAPIRTPASSSRLGGEIQLLLRQPRVFLIPSSCLTSPPLAIEAWLGAFPRTNRCVINPPFRFGQGTKPSYISLLLYYNYSSPRARMCSPSG